MLRTLSLVIAILCAGVAAAQSPYPDRPVRVAVGFAAGGVVVVGAPAAFPFASGRPWDDAPWTEHT